MSTSGSTITLNRPGRLSDYVSSDRKSTEEIYYDTHTGFSDEEAESEESQSSSRDSLSSAVSNADSNSSRFTAPDTAVLTKSTEWSNDDQDTTSPALTPQSDEPSTPWTKPVDYSGAGYGDYDTGTGTNTAGSTLDSPQTSVWNNNSRASTKTPGDSRSAHSTGMLRSTNDVQSLGSVLTSAVSSLAQSSASFIPTGSRGRLSSFISRVSSKSASSKPIPTDAGHITLMLPSQSSFTASLRPLRLSTLGNEEKLVRRPRRPYH